ncbi:MAG TPA: MFS transporter, partial [Candidatus Nitrosotalea sp.]|nr:MFS transporter [Candidatus Nitrosotalea sp.]
MSVLLILVGQSLGPSVAGMFQQMYSQTIPNIPGVFPTALSYLEIFSSAGILSIVSIVLVVLLRNKVKAQPSYNLES